MPNTFLAVLLVLIAAGPVAGQQGEPREALPTDVTPYRIRGARHSITIEARRRSLNSRSKSRRLARSAPAMRR